VLVAAGLRSGVGSQIAGIEVETEIDCAGPIRTVKWLLLLRDLKSSKIGDRQASPWCARRDRLDVQSMVFGKGM
jgi:hypothetical protein